MAKKQSVKLTDTVEALRPYLDRALTDPDFRTDLKDALEAARELYGPLSKRNGGVQATAKKLASDKKAQESLRRALEDLQSATKTLQGKSKKRKRRGRKTLLLAGVIAGALYNPWTGQQTREWLLDRIAGDDELQPLEDIDVSSPAETSETAAEPAEA